MFPLSVMHWGVQIFFIKREGLVKQGGLFEKTGYHLYFYSNSFQCYLSLSVCCVCVCVCVCVCMCVFCLFRPFLSVLFVFHRKNQVLQHLIKRYMTFTSELFLKRKFWGSVNYSLNVINISCCEHIKSGVNIYLYECVSVH